MFLSILKVITAGFIGGFFLFLIPFLIFKAVLFFLFAGLIFRLIAGRRRYRRWRRYHSGFYGYPNGESAETNGNTWPIHSTTRHKKCNTYSSINQLIKYHV